MLLIKNNLIKIQSHTATNKQNKTNNIKPNYIYLAYWKFSCSLLGAVYSTAPNRNLAAYECTKNILKLTYYQHRYTQCTGERKVTLSFIFTLSIRKTSKSTNTIDNRLKFHSFVLPYTNKMSQAFSMQWQMQRCLSPSLTFVLHFVIMLWQVLHNYLWTLFYLWHHRIQPMKTDRKFQTRQEDANEFPRNKAY